MAETHPVELRLTRSLPGCCVPHGILEAQFIRDLEPGLDGPKGLGGLLTGCWEGRILSLSPPPPGTAPAGVLPFLPCVA